MNNTIAGSAGPISPDSLLASNATNIVVSPSTLNGIINISTPIIDGIICLLIPQPLDNSRVGVFFVTNVLLVQLLLLIHLLFYEYKPFHQLLWIYAPSSGQYILCLHPLNPILNGKCAYIHEVYVQILVHP